MKKQFITLFLIGFVGHVFAQETEEADIYSLSLEELLNMEVYSISKKEEKLQNAASSIYVLTNDDIIESGATTLHEVLRNVPGYWGTQVEYNTLVNTDVRNSRTLDNLNGTILYLLDGTPLQDLMSSSFTTRNFDIPLEDIDRIELIRGSGGTVYGANSATGVVNIYTKDPTKYEGLLVRAEGASPGYVNTSISAGKSLNEKVAVGGYAKVRYFTGFDSFAGKDIDGNVIGESRFMEDTEKSTMMSFGLKGSFELSASTKFSFKGHLNVLDKYEYTNTIDENSFSLTTQSIEQDLLFGNEVEAKRYVGNIRMDHSFNENHSLFVRLSSNHEDDFIGLGGGFRINNGIIDLEMQDNISIGEFNDLSIGANYRWVNFDISDINSTETINFIDPQSSESLKGGFIQNRTRLVNDKLSLIAGIKTENYSLVNEKFYLSPMLKFSYNPFEQLTVWGGFTQSFTTPGFYNTNADLFLFQTPSEEAWTQAATAGVYQAVYEQAIAAGADQVTADAQATGFLGTPEGQAQVTGLTQQLITENPNFAVRNGSNTVPTRYQTLELGVRTNFDEKYTFESNLFYNLISDGTEIQNLNEVADTVASPTQPERIAVYYLYGNYIQGNSYGAETMFRAQFSENFGIELSHSWLVSTWEFQENDDFDINDANLIQDKDRTPDVPFTPEHVIRGQIDYSFGNGFKANAGVIYATEYNISNSYRFDDERYQNIASSSLEPSSSTLVENVDSRTIVNLRLEKSFLDNSLKIYLFGNDIFNEGAIANTFRARNATIHQIAGMYGAGLIFSLN